MFYSTTKLKIVATIPSHANHMSSVYSHGNFRMQDFRSPL